MTAIDMSRFIAPKSDQLNSDDLIGGPVTIRITKVSAVPDSAEQPIAVSFEGDGGKPYKPCKSMRRVMVHVWGADASKYVGRAMTLYRDPAVQFGGMAVGGIRISHMSDITRDMTMALTATRANRKPFTVKPLAMPRGDAAPAADRQAEQELRHRLSNAADLTELDRVWKVARTTPGKFSGDVWRSLKAVRDQRGEALRNTRPADDDLDDDVSGASGPAPFARTDGLPGYDLNAASDSDWQPWLDEFRGDLQRATDAATAEDLFEKAEKGDLKDAPEEVRAEAQRLRDARVEELKAGARR